MKSGDKWNALFKGDYFCIIFLQFIHIYGILDQ